MVEFWEHLWGSVLPYWGVWTVTILLIVVGFAGTILPFLPGPLLIFLAGVWQTWMSDQGMSVTGLIILGVLLIISFLLDYFSGVLGAKWFGGTKWAMIGGIVGGIVGLFFPPFGILVGPLVGVFVFEILFAKAKIGSAGKSTLGTAVGTTVGAVVKGFNSVLMIFCILADIFWW